MLGALLIAAPGSNFRRRDDPTSRPAPVPKFEHQQDDTYRNQKFRGYEQARMLPFGSRRQEHRVGCQRDRAQRERYARHERLQTCLGHADDQPRAFVDRGLAGEERQRVTVGAGDTLYSFVMLRK